VAIYIFRACRTIPISLLQKDNKVDFVTYYIILWMLNIESKFILIFYMYLFIEI